MEYVPRRRKLSPASQERLRQQQEAQREEQRRENEARARARDIERERERERELERELERPSKPASPKKGRTITPTKKNTRKSPPKESKKTW
jgi:hypothetical protein